MSEPVYQGKPLSSWLKDMENWNGNTNDAAFMAFRDMGSNAIPPLLRVLQSGGGRFRHMVMAVNDKQSVVQLPFGKPWEQSMAAARGLYAMGSNARPALPALTNLLFHSNETITSAIAMAGIGTDALPILLSALSNQNYRIRIAAVSALGEERSDLEIVVPALIGSLRDTNQLVHWSAATSLGQLHAEPDIAVPALMNDFPSNDKQLRSGILIALGQFENKARKAIPMILEALKDSDNNVSNCAVFALRQIDPAAAANAGIK
ncbi:MAG TPA: HEAT repeat domain-containing protein [Verrucomicrobiae bacterium]|nr:HEAT repeat domain-containing protein [Verrucomicrobiae bacterium]